MATTTMIDHVLDHAVVVDHAPDHVRDHARDLVGPALDLAPDHDGLDHADHALGPADQDLTQALLDHRTLPDLN